MDGRPPSRQIEEAVLTRSVVEDAEEDSGPPCFDSRGERIDLLTRPFNRSVSELALGGNPGGVRPRANSLQDDRRLRSPPRNLSLDGPILMKSLPTLGTTPPPFEELASGKPLNVEAPPFVPTPGSNTPPTNPSEDTTTTVPPSALDHSPIVESVEPLSSPFHLEGRDSISLSSSVSSITVKPITPVKSGLPSNKWFSRNERRAVEMVINILLELKGKGEARVNPTKLPPLILARDRKVYKHVGSRANRFWKLVSLGIQMGWLEVGPGNAWIDVGKGWTEETGSQV